jgi:hypothetical protein
MYTLELFTQSDTTGYIRSFDIEKYCFDNENRVMCVDKDGKILIISSNWLYIIYEQ